MKNLLDKSIFHLNFLTLRLELDTDAILDSINVDIKSNSIVFNDENWENDS